MSPLQLRRLTEQEGRCPQARRALHAPLESPHGVGVAPTALSSHPQCSQLVLHGRGVGVVSECAGGCPGTVPVTSRTLTQGASRWSRGTGQMVSWAGGELD